MKEEFNFNRGISTEASRWEAIEHIFLLSTHKTLQLNEGLLRTTSLCCGLCENLSIHAEIIPIKCLHLETLQRINKKKAAKKKTL